MKINQITILAVLFFAFPSMIIAQKNTAKIEIDNQDYMHHETRNNYTSSEMRTASYIKIDGQYIGEDPTKNEKILKQAFKDCPKANKLAMKYVDAQRRGKKMGLTTKIVTGSILAGGIIYYASTGEDSGLKELSIFGASGLAGYVANMVLRKRKNKTTVEGFKNLVSAINYFNKNCYVDIEEVGGSTTAKNIDNKINKEKSDEPFTITNNDPFSSFVKTNFGIVGVGGTISSSLGLGIDASYFKKGILFDSELVLPLVEKHRYFWKKYESVKINFGSIASPTEPKLSIYSRIGMTYPISKKIKNKMTNIGLGRSRDITFISKVKLKRLSTWGARVDLEFDRSFKQRISNVEELTIIGPETNDQMQTIVNPVVLQSSANIAFGVSRSTYLNFTLNNNDNRFSSKEVKVLYFDTYLVAKYNLYHSFSDMTVYNRTSSINAPFVFNNVAFNNIGFAAGINASSFKNHKGFSFGLEIGNNPHLKYDNWLDIYAKAKLGYTIGKNL